MKFPKKRVFLTNIMGKPFFTILFGLCLLTATGLAAAPRWYRGGDRGSGELQPESTGEFRARVEFPGSTQLYREPERRSFRPRREDFDRGALRVEVRRLSGTLPVKVNLFIKDKDGRFFSSDRLLELDDDRWQTLEVRLDEPGRNWRPVGHQAEWSAQFAATIFAAGLNLYSAEMGEAQLEWRNFELVGERRRPELKLRNWQLPDDGEAYQLLKSTFDLSREYFNPYDPEEIAVDFALRSPDGQERVYPAYFEIPHRRTRHFTLEKIEPVGRGNWAFRLTPPAPGRYQLQLRIRDRTPGHEEALTSEWRDLVIRPSTRPGFVQVARNQPDYFELSTGEFFYPIGLNIHTNIDLRSEYQLGFESLPDRGTFDYDDYFRACGRAGINLVEVWMAAWTMALEWTSSRADYYGLGRYNQANAWKLDHLLDQARANGIRLNLVLDNHGKTSVHSDMEWAESPFNAHSLFAAADGGFLEDAGKFFASPEVRKYNTQRNRYIAARWGADPAIMAIELWSEVDLTHQFRQSYQEETALKWHAEVAREFLAMSQGPHLITTHVCGDYRNNLNYRKLYELPEMSHVAGDAYRDSRIHFVDQLERHGAELNFGKPRLVTEFGGPSTGAGVLLMIADIHAGLWSSIFHRQAGAPMLWWHDFVHLGNHYAHYRGLANYLRGVDLRNRALMRYPLRIWRPKPADEGRLDEAGNRLGPSLSAAPPLLRGPLPPFKLEDPELRFDGLALSSTDTAYGWIYCRRAMRSWSGRPGDFPEVRDLAFELASPLERGIYLIEYFDTLSGEVVNELVVEHPGGGIKLPLPGFRVDLAFKLRQLAARPERPLNHRRRTPEAVTAAPVPAETAPGPELPAPAPELNWRYPEARGRLLLSGTSPEFSGVLDLRQLTLPFSPANGVELCDGEGNELPFQLTPELLLTTAAGTHAGLELYYGFPAPRAKSRGEFPEPSPPLLFLGKHQNGRLSETEWREWRKQQLRRNYEWRYQNDLKTIGKYWLELIAAPHFFVRYPLNAWQVVSNYRTARDLEELRRQHVSGLLRPRRYRPYYRNNYPVRSYLLSRTFYQNQLRWAMESFSRFQGNYRRDLRQLAMECFNAPQRELKNALDNERRRRVGAMGVMDLSIPPRPFDAGGTLALRFTGKLLVPETGTYDFRVRAQSLAVLSLDDEEVLHLWGERDQQESRTGEVTVELTAGPHDLKLDFQRHDQAKWLSGEWRRSGTGEPYRHLTQDDFRTGLPLTVTVSEDRAGNRYPLAERRDEMEFFLGKQERLTLERYRLLLPEQAPFRLFRNGEAVLDQTGGATILQPRAGEEATPTSFRLEVPGWTPLTFRREHKAPVSRVLPLALELKCFRPRFLHDDQSADLFAEVHSQLPLPLTVELESRVTRPCGELTSARTSLELPPVSELPENRFAPGAVVKRHYRLEGSELEGTSSEAEFILRLGGRELDRQRFRFIPVADLPEELEVRSGTLVDADGTPVIPVLHHLTLPELRTWELVRELNQGFHPRHRLLVVAADWRDAAGTSFREELERQLNRRGLELEFLDWRGPAGQLELLSGLPALLRGIRNSDADVALVVAPPGTLLHALPPWDQDDLLALVVEALDLRPELHTILLGSSWPAADAGDREQEERQTHFLRRLGRERGLRLLEFGLYARGRTAPLSATTAAELLLRRLH